MANTTTYRKLMANHGINMRDIADIVKSLKIDASNGIPLDRVKDILAARTDTVVESETDKVVKQLEDVEKNNVWDTVEDTEWDTGEDITEDMKVELTDQNFIDIELDQMKETIETLTVKMLKMDRDRIDLTSSINALRRQNTELYSHINALNTEMMSGRDTEKRDYDKFVASVNKTLTKQSATIFQQSADIAKHSEAIGGNNDDILFLDKKIKTDLITRREAESFLQSIYDVGIENITKIEADGKEMIETTQAIVVAFADSAMDDVIEQINDLLDSNNKDGIVYQMRQTVLNIQNKYFVFMFKLLVSSRMNTYQDTI